MGVRITGQCRHFNRWRAHSGVCCLGSGYAVKRDLGSVTGCSSFSAPWAINSGTLEKRSSRCASGLKRINESAKSKSQGSIEYLYW